MIRLIENCIDDIFSERSLDKRSCYVNVTSEDPDGGGTIVCECSDPAVLDELRVRVSRDAGGDRTVRFVALPSNVEKLPRGLIASVSVANVRRAASHASELVTQILYGDPVEPLKKEGDWYLARLDDGYIGWIRDWHLVELSVKKQKRYEISARHRVAVNVAAVLEAPGRSSLPVTDLVAGTPVDVRDCGERGWRLVALPDGKTGYIAAGAVEKKPVGIPTSGEGLVSTGLRFLGIPYLWGGTTPKGFDCSGLVQRIFRLHGLLLPRDADQQSRAGREKSAGILKNLAAGDLIFFGKSVADITHVGLHISNGMFLQASGRVRTGSLDPANKLYDAGLAVDWRASRDFITGC